MNKKLFSLIIGTICLCMVVTPISTSFAQSLTSEETPNDEILEDELEEVGGSLIILELIEQLPEDIAENGIAESVNWLNANKGEEFTGQEFVANGEYLNLVEDEAIINTRSVSGCVWGIRKAIAMNALPWSKILKIKKAAKIMGGTKVVAKTVINAYKHQRNLG